MPQDQRKQGNAWRIVAQCIFGAIGVVLNTFVCFRLGLGLLTPTLLYLLIVVLISLQGSFISAALISFVAVGCLAYYFVPPVFSFRISDPIDLVAIAVFLITAAIITRLVTRVRQLMEEKLRLSEAYLAEAQQLSHTGSFGWKVATGEITWSEETFRIFGCDPRQKPTMELLLQRIHPEDTAMVKDLIERASSSGQDWRLEHRLLLPGGAVKHVEVVARAVPGQSGRLEFVGAIMDVTERKRAEEALRTAQSNLAHVARLTTVGELAASIAHEVNQPLAAVVTNGNACLRWLEREPPNLDEVRDGVRRIIRDGNRGSQIIARIRALLKRKPAARERLNVNELIRETAALARVDWRGAEFRADLAPDLPEVFADRVQLQQVLLNLMMNAMDAMTPVTDRPRVLRIRTSSREGREVRVSVEDSGVGLTPETAEQVFETFYTTKPEGLGMGLSICRSIIEGHGGRLWVEPHDGPGAVFQFTLPIDTEEPHENAR